MLGGSLTVTCALVLGIIGTLIAPMTEPSAVCKKRLNKANNM
jgi:hypothetical protein